MRMSLILAASVLAGCGGVSASNFGDKFVEKYCAELETCNATAAETCVEDSEEGEEVDTSDCEFDKDAAKDCLDATYECDDSFGEGFEFLVPDASCIDVFDCPAGDTAEM